MIASLNLLLQLLKKEIKTMWKNLCLDMFESTAPSPSEEEKEEEAKKIHQWPNSNHKLIYICLPVKNRYYNPNHIYEF